MSNGTIEFDEFEDIQSTDVKLNILFKTVVKNHNEQLDRCHCRQEKCDKRIGKLENRKRFDTAVSGGGGVIGGILAYIGSKLWGL